MNCGAPSWTKDAANTILKNQTSEITEKKVRYVMSICVILRGIDDLGCLALNKKTSCCCPLEVPLSQHTTCRASFCIFRTPSAFVKQRLLFLRSTYFQFFSFS